MFEGLGARQAWALFYDVACMCHPSQGGSDADFRGLCALAREAMADEWPSTWTLESPKLFDIFCKVTETPQLDMSTFRPNHDDDGPPGLFVSAFACASPAGRVGRVLLVDRLR